MSFHGHCLCDSFATLRQSEHDGGDSLCHVQHLVNAHADVGGFEPAFKFFVALQGHEADADVRLDALACEVEHGAYLDFRLCNAERPLYVQLINLAFIPGDADSCQFSILAFYSFLLLSHLHYLTDYVSSL